MPAITLVNKFEILQAVKEEPGKLAKIVTDNDTPVSQFGPLHQQEKLLLQHVDK